MDDTKKSSNKSFGIVFFILFILISFYPLLNGNTIRLWALVIAFIFLILSYLNPRILTPFNKLWFMVGISLGKAFSPIIMGIIFFFVATPTGYILRIFKKDILSLKFNKKKSYWIDKNEPKSKMKNQF